MVCVLTGRQSVLLTGRQSVLLIGSGVADWQAVGVANGSRYCLMAVVSFVHGAGRPPEGMVQKKASDLIVQQKRASRQESCNS